MIYPSKFLNYFKNLSRKIPFSIKTQFVLLAVFIMILMNVGTLTIFYFARNEISQNEIDQAEKILEVLSVEILEYLSGFKHDVVVLSKTSAIEGLIQIKDLSSENRGEAFENRRRELEDIFIAFSESKPWYMQIRYIDESGQEIIRVDRRSKEEKVVIIAQEDLQNKKDRYYFQDAIKLSPGEIYASELDLNIEDGEIEKPFKPTIRYAAPVFDESGQNRGILIINVLASNLLNFIKFNYDDVLLVDEMNYFLLNNEDSQKEWSKYLGNDYKFEELEEEHEFISSELIHHNSYSYLDQDDQHLELYQKITYNEANPSQYWVLAQIIPFNDLYINVNLLQKNTFLVNLCLFIVFSLIFIYFAFNFTSPILRLIRAIKKLDHGDYNFEIDNLRKDEIGLLTKKMNQFITSFRELEKDRAEFITSASHQLRTPSSGVTMQLSLLGKKLKEKLKDKQILAEWKEISDNNSRTVVILNDLLKLLELGDRYFASNFKTVSLKELVSSIVNSLQERIAQQNLEVTIDIPEDLEPEVEESGIKTVFINLIDNAVKYSNKGSKIIIKAELSDNVVIIQVSDTGIGIPQDEQIKIFDKFFRAKNSYAKESVGSGLGLVIVKKIIEGHGGKISFKSQENKSSTFYFSLPYKKDNE